jgi:hypothetical protein
VFVAPYIIGITSLSVNGDSPECPLPTQFGGSSARSRMTHLGQIEPVSAASSNVALGSDTGPSFAGCPMSQKRPRSHGRLASDRRSLRVRLLLHPLWRDPGGRTEMADGFNSRPKEWSRPPEPHPPDAGCWCSRNTRRPYVSLIWCSTPSGHGNGLRPWIRTNRRRTAHEPLNLTLDLEHAHVSSH